MGGQARKAAEIAVIFLILVAIVGGMAYSLAGRSSVGAASCEQNIMRINLAVEKWFFDNGQWPALDLSDIAADRRYFPGGPPRCPVNGQPYRLDPRTHRVIPHHH